MARIAMLDADVIAYVASAEAEAYKDIDWGGEVTTVEGGLAKATEVASMMVEQWSTFAEADETLLAFSGESLFNFRRDVHKGYKSNRTSEKPKLYGTAVQWLKDHYPYKEQENLEGDDIIGMFVTGSSDDVHVGVSTDKDIKTLPGNLVHVTRAGPVVMNQSLFEANHFWMTQVLTGDRVDAYLGAPGVGEKGAEKALSGIHELSSMWQAVVASYNNQYTKPRQRQKFVTNSPWTEALMNARCARILRDGDYDYNTKEVKLWTP